MKMKKSKVITYEDWAKEDKFLNENGTLNRNGYRTMMCLVNSSCRGKYENGYGYFLLSRTRDNYL